VPAPGIVKPKVVVSLLTSAQEFQLMQAADARAAGPRTGLEVEVVFAENNAIQQIHQLYSFIHLPEGQRPAAILVEAVSSDGMERVARNALKAGITWVVQQWRAEYVATLRAEKHKAPIITVAVDEEEIGTIQARQIRALLPRGGGLVLLQGPSDSTTVTRRRDSLMRGLKDSGVELTTALQGDWTAKSAEAAVTSWLRLKSTEGLRVDAVVSQNDSMASGARDAVKALRSDWTRLPFIGCDGLPEGGRRMVASGDLAATVIKPTTTGAAVELVARMLRGQPAPPEVALHPESHPPLEELSRRRARKD
jgi:ABC-type sugar transport system substrate-binding protein